MSSPNRFAISPLNIASRNSFCFNNVKICKHVGYLLIRQGENKRQRNVHDELGVLPIPEILEILEVVHEPFILKELAFSENYRSDGIKGRSQLRY
jgi:hypothetical protein